MVNISQTNVWHICEIRYLQICHFNKNLIWSDKTCLLRCSEVAVQFCDFSSERKKTVNDILIYTSWWVLFEMYQDNTGWTEQSISWIWFCQYHVSLVFTELSTMLSRNIELSSNNLNSLKLTVKYSSMNSTQRFVPWNTIENDLVWNCQSNSTSHECVDVRVVRECRFCNFFLLFLAVVS